MSRIQRRNNLMKTLSTEDIHKVMDKYGGGLSSLSAKHVVASYTPNNQISYSDEQNIEINESGTKFYVERKHMSLQDEWDFLFHGNDFVERLRQLAFDGNIGTKNFRSVCWRVFWECLSEDKENWKNELVEKRNIYTNIRKKYVIDPYEEEKDIDLNTHHPLSQAEDSVWHKYFQDNELRSTIMQDLDRLFPEIEFFQQEEIKTVLLRLLFCYAREHPQVSYKQGMHEILSVLIYVIYDNCSVVATTTENISDIVKVTLDKQFLEHDAYVLFVAIMDSMEAWFTNITQVDSSTKNPKLPNDQRIFQNPVESQLVSAISKKLNRVQWYMLKRYDSALCDHMRKVDITPQLYGIRWIRLLYGREFSIPKLLTLWDGLFADGISLDLVDYIYLAMLINLRGVLLQSDFNTCLSYLMKYPENTDTKYILKKAVGLKYYKPPPLKPQPQTHPQRPVKAVHPVRNRLGETKEQMYASALGSGTANDSPTKRTGSFANVIHKNKKPPEFYTDGTDGSNQNGTKAQFIADPSQKEGGEGRSVKSSVASQISNLKTKVGVAPQQIISKIPNALRNKTHNKNETMDAIVEDHGRLQKQVVQLQSELDKLQSFCLYCGEKMEFYLNTLQDRLLNEEQFSDEVGILSLAGLKQREYTELHERLQVRDILKNGSDIRGSANEHDVDFNDIDNHIESASNGRYSRGQTTAGSENASEETSVGYLADFNHYNSENNSPTSMSGPIDNNGSENGGKISQNVDEELSQESLELNLNDKNDELKNEDLKVELSSDHKRLSPLAFDDISDVQAATQHQPDYSANELDPISHDLEIAENSFISNDKTLDPLSIFQ